MNNFFPAINMYRYPRYNAYIPPPGYKIEANSYGKKEITTKNNYDSDNTSNNNSNNSSNNNFNNSFDNNSYNNFFNDSDNTNIKNTKKKSKEKRNHLNEKPLFEIHGIQLYNDDVLILLLIFFLYKEQVNDMLLLIALFSLLF